MVKNIITKPMTAYYILEGLLMCSSNDTTSGIVDGIEATTGLSLW